MYQRIQLILMSVLPALSVGTLHKLGSQPWAKIPAEALRSAPTTATAAALLRLVAMAVAVWVTLTTTGYLVSRLLGLVRSTSTIGKGTAPYFRRIVDQAIVTTAIVATVAASPSIAAPPPIAAPITVGEVARAPLDRASPARIEVPRFGTYEVVSGDSFWKIAVARAPTPDIARYWLDLIKLNLGMISSGDPNLIFPGEVLQLPPT